MILDQMNILLLGPTGVGKSCFINALCNYLCYESIEEAMSGGVKVPIATKFTVFNKTTSRHEDVLIGDNSSGEETFGDGGESSTRHAQSYLFEFPIDNAQKSIRIIDTPGVGDTKGIQADKENFRDIMSLISSISTLNGIVIMLKSNEARLNAQLEYCITELFSHLHKNATKNIVFCFTSTLQTEYSVGETIKPLGELLKRIERNSGIVIPLDDSTMYCFENETFRFLAAGAANPGSDVRRKPPTESWEMSSREACRLLSHLNNLEPHTADETISIERVRSILEALEEPFGFLASNIDDNIKRVEQHKKRIKECGTSIEELAKNVKFTKKVISVRNLGHFKNVCTNSRCVKYVQTADGIKILYKTVCHDHCSRTEWRDAEAQSRSFSFWLGLKRWSCSAINLVGECKRCGCHMICHVFINYDTEVLDVEEENPEVATKIAEEQNAAKITEALLEDADARVNQLEMERMTIDQVSSRFAVFLHLNSLTATNDYAVRYWRSQIKARRDLNSDHRNEGEILRMEQAVDKHEQSILRSAELLKKRYNSNDMTLGQMSLSSIMADVQRLSDLPLSGQAFRQVLSAIEKPMAIDETKSNGNPHRFGSNERVKCTLAGAPSFAFKAIRTFVSTQI